MNRLILLAICLLVLPLSLRAQLAKDVFKAMPDSLNLLLTSVNRADFIDFLESKMKAEVTNRFDGKSEMTALTPDYIHIRMTPQSTWEMKLLPLTDSTKVVCAVSTVCAPACDSHIRFYTTDWKELPAADFLPALPVTDDFIEAAPRLGRHLRLSGCPPPGRYPLPEGFAFAYRCRADLHLLHPRLYGKRSGGPVETFCPPPCGLYLERGEIRHFTLILSNPSP